MAPRTPFGIRLFTLLPLFSVAAYAQTPPDAGALRQQIEQQLPKAIPDRQKPITALPPEHTLAPGLKVTVKTFRFAGNTLLTAEQLAPAVAPFLNRPLDFKALQNATAAVSDAYRSAGWLVRVYLPRQEIADGVVTLQVVEGVFGKVRIAEPAPLRLSLELGKAYIAAAQPVGEPISAAALDRALLTLDDLPGVAVTGNLAPGERPAETDLILKLADEPLMTGDVGLDNTGSRATGRDRLTANAFVNSPLQIGDQLSANFIHTQGSDYGRLSYSVPVGYDGLRLGANASSMDYDVIAPEFKAAGIHGNSTSYGLDLWYPLLRSRTRNLYLSAAYDDKRYDNQANTATSSNYGLRNFTLSLSGNLFDNWGGGSANMASLALTTGELDLGTLDPSENAGLAGRFTKLRYALSRQQSLTPDVSLYGLLTGQLADSNLDSAEKFYLGGSSGVRAYPASEAGGAEGNMINLELRWRAMPTLVVAGFYDWGQVSQNHDNNVPAPANPNRIALQGAGVSVAWTGPKGLNLKAVYARRIGNNPNRDATTGKDQDGSLVLDRLWLTASLPF
jgi:hemolysin activation/secretion protein